MKGTLTRSLLLFSASWTLAHAFVVPPPFSPFSGMRILSASVDSFYDPDDPSLLRVSEIRDELNRRQVEYGDCLEKQELEQRLRDARANPQQFSVPDGGPVGMKSVETKFQGLRQNVQGVVSHKKETFFGDLEGVIEHEGTLEAVEKTRHFPSVTRQVTPPPRKVKGPSRWTQEDTAFMQGQQQQQQQQQQQPGGQSLHGYLESEQQEQHWHYEETGPPKTETFFTDAVPASTEPASSPSPTSSANRWSQFDGIQVEQAANHDRFSGKHPSNAHSSRWSSWEGVRVEAPSNDHQAVRFGPNTAPDRIQVEKPKERYRHAKTNVEPATPWDGMRVEASGTTHTDDPFASVRKQQPSYQTDNDLTIEQSQQQQHPYKRANPKNKQQYTGQRNFRSDQQASSTTVFQGIQVEQVPGGKEDLHITSYNREDQGGSEKNWSKDPQRAQHHAHYKGIQVECASGERPLPPFQKPQQAPPQQQQQQPQPPPSKAKTTTFQGVRTNHNHQPSVPPRSASHNPDDPFAQPTLEHPDPNPHGVGPAYNVDVAYQGTWENTIGGGESGGNGEDDDEQDNGSVSGAMDIDGRL